MIHGLVSEYSYLKGAAESQQSGVEILRWGRGRGGERGLSVVLTVVNQYSNCLIRATLLETLRATYRLVAATDIQRYGCGTADTRQAAVGLNSYMID